MKKLILIILVSIGSISVELCGCPTCIGHNHEESPPFFSEEFYTPNNESMNELYEELIQEQNQAQSTAEQPTKKEAS